MLPSNKRWEILLEPKHIHEFCSILLEIDGATLPDRLTLRFYNGTSYYWIVCNPSTQVKLISKLKFTLIEIELPGFEI